MSDPRQAARRVPDGSRRSPRSGHGDPRPRRLPLTASAPLEPLGADEFSARLDRLGPFEPAPTLACAVSGGADSMALAVLSRDWAATRSGRVVALVVDHGLRTEAPAEAALTRDRLAQLGIEARILTLSGLARGPSLAERARVARHAALEAACADAGHLHLLFGHHAGDQAETILMRHLARSGPDGLAGMAAIVETAALRRLRPLLDVPPGRLRATLRDRSIAWVEDPSNADPSTLRARLRFRRDDPQGTGRGTAILVAGAARRGEARASAERRAAEALADVEIRPEGYAVLPRRLPPGPAMAALIRMVTGAGRSPSARRIAGLLADPRPATLGGARLIPAGRLGAGWLLVREVAAQAPPVAAERGVRWDGRFRLIEDHPGASLGAVGPDLDAALRRRLGREWPAAVASTLPALRRGGKIVAVPHLDDPGAIVFAPPLPAACAPFAFAKPGC